LNRALGAFSPPILREHSHGYFDDGKADEFVLGLHGETVVEIKQGLKEDEVVVKAEGGRKGALKEGQ
jgi:hypothetical protein